MMAQAYKEGLHQTRDDMDVHLLVNFKRQVRRAAGTIIAQSGREHIEQWEGVYSLSLAFSASMALKAPATRNKPSVCMPVTPCQLAATK